MKLYSIELEMGALRTALKSKDKINRAKFWAKLNEDFFHDEVTSSIYKRIKKLNSKGDFPTYEDLIVDPLLSEETREELSSSEAKIRNDENGIKKLYHKLDEYRKVRLIYFNAQNTLKELDKETVDVDRLVQRTLDTTTKVAIANVAEDDQLVMGHQSNANKFLKNILNKTKQEFIPTGFYTFDERNMGLIPGSLVTVAATSGGGKSLMAVQLGINIARAGKRVRLVPLEMTKEECYARVVSNISGISMRKIMNGKLTDREKAKVKKKWRAFEKECKRLGGRFTIWDPEEDLSMEDVLNIAKPYNDDVVIIDYIGLLSGVDGDDAWQALGRVARYAKIWAKTNKKVVILAAQLSDDGQIRYSRAIKEHCVTGDTSVIVDGKMITVADLAKMYKPTKEGIDFVHTIETASGVRNTIKFYQFDKKQVKRITLADGNNLGVSSTTPLLVLDNRDYSVRWIKAGDVNKKYHSLLQSTRDRQITGGSTPLTLTNPELKTNGVVYKTPTRMTANLARVLGYLSSEGYMASKGNLNQVHFCNQVEDVMIDFVTRFNSVFGTNLTYGWSNQTNTFNASICSKHIYSLLDQMGATGSSHTKKVPHVIVNSSRYLQLEYLVGFLEGDGFSTSKKSPFVGFSVYSKDLALTIARMVRSFGCRCSYKVTTDYKGDKFYNVYMPALYNDKVEDLFLGLNDLNPNKWGLNWVDNKSFNSSYGMIQGFGTHMRKYKQGTKNCMYDAQGERLPYGYGLACCPNLTSQNLMLNGFTFSGEFKAMCKEYFRTEYETLELLTKYKLEPVSITSIKTTNEVVYDFTVERDNLEVVGEGHFLANGLVVHNSNLMWTWTYGDENRESGVIDIVQQKARNQDPFDFQLGVDMSGMKMYDLDGDVETHRPKKGQLSTKSKKGEKAHAKLKDSSDDVGAYL